jgi:hypothetical protein
LQLPPRSPRVRRADVLRIPWAAASSCHGHRWRWRHAIRVQRLDDWVDYDNYGDVWPSSLAYPQLTGELHPRRRSTPSAVRIAASFSVQINHQVEIGDLEDETGVTTSAPTRSATYVGCAYADAGPAGTRSDYSLNISGLTNSETDCQKSRASENHRSLAGRP